jgi:hypothetical protein
MHVSRLKACLGIVFTVGVLALAVVAWAQGRRPGLYDVTTNMTFQKSPFPAGVGPGARGPQTSQACVTQEQIDKYGGTPPQKREGCEISNMVKKANGFSADMTCSGRMASKGTVESVFSEDGHGKTTIHMVGTMQMGPNPSPVEYTVVSESTFKGADCGSVKPIEAK